MSDPSGHQAGYDWAADNDITDKKQCPINPHNSRSFTLGCYAYVEEQTEVAPRASSPTTQRRVQNPAAR